MAAQGTEMGEAMAKREGSKMVGGLDAGRSNRADERLIAIFALGALLFLPAVVLIFDSRPRASIAGLPLLYIFLFGAWALIIGLLALVVEGAHLDQPPQSASGGHGGEHR